MRTLVLVVAALAVLTFLPTPAQAQQSSSIVLALNPPAEALTKDTMLTFSGTVVYTADYTAMLALSGIPVSYSVVNAPAWASVVVSPASDVFPMPSHPGMGASYSVARTITVTVTLAHAMAEDATGAIEIAATTRAAPLGHAATGVGAVPILYDAPEEDCHELSEAELLAMAREAANAYVEQSGTDITTDAPTTDAGSDELHVQTGGASTLPVPWIAVAGFALVGAGVGLILKKRLGR